MDITRDGIVDVDDLRQTFGHWGDDAGQQDVTGDGVVDVDDLIAVMADWGECP